MLPLQLDDTHNHRPLQDKPQVVPGWADGPWTGPLDRDNTNIRPIDWNRICLGLTRNAAQIYCCPADKFHFVATQWAWMALPLRSVTMDGYVGARGTVQPYTGTPMPDGR